MVARKLRVKTPVFTALNCTNQVFTHNNYLIQNILSSINFDIIKIKEIEENRDIHTM